MTTPVVTVGPETTWEEIAERMIDAHVTALPVVDGDDFLLGLVTESDLLGRKVSGGQRRRTLATVMDLRTSGAAHGAGQDTTSTAADLMTTAVFTTTPREDVGAAGRRMLDRQVKRLPVIDGGRLVGIVSRQDVLRTLLSHDIVTPTELAETVGNGRCAPS